MQHAEARLIGGRDGFTWEQLPAGRLRTAIEKLGTEARQRAEEWLRGFSFPPEDLEHLHVDRQGGVLYVDRFPVPVSTDAAPDERGTAAASEAVAVSPFPTNLYFHSRPGAANILYLDFDGETVTGTAWNEYVGRDPIPAVAFSTDSDDTTFSEYEQADIERIWQRVAEDYAPFDIDVTTERPAAFDRRTAHALITRNTDADGLGNPASSAGGIAYVNVFGTTSFDYYRPAWVYANNLSLRESYIAEAASHEVGHNMGLSHDGKTDGTTYYSGHGSGDTSWAPIMGVGYYRNVSQWCRGEYYLANNTEDDMAIIAGKLQYRADDHGDTTASATYLTVSDGSNIVSTTPATDPQNSQPENKGVVENESDIDLFAFVTGAGEIKLTVRPWISPVSTRGGDLDVELSLLDGSGMLLAATNPPSATTASLTLSVAEGQYYLQVTGAGTGDPYSSTPSGYTSYASAGQYFISGTLVDASHLIVAPQAALQAGNIIDGGQSAHSFEVTYSDDVAMDVSTLDSADIRVTGPNAYDAAASLAGIDIATDGTPRTATYAVTPPGATWEASDNGTYEVFVLTNAVSDTEGAFVAARKLGEFACGIPSPIYRADLDSDPGWSLEGEWAYGQPQGSAGDPSAGYDGSNVVGYNLAGAYGRNLAAAFATMPAVDCSSSTDSVVLRFRRWLGVESGDSAVIQVSTNGSSWLDVWTPSSSISDAQWVTVQYDITAYAAGQQTVYIRWGLSSNPDGRLSYGWNLDAVEMLGSGGMLDTQAPGATLSAPELSEGGNPNYQFAVAYTDDVAVATQSLGDTNLVVIGPNSYSNAASFSGVDDPSDGTPRTASYAIPAPGGAWDEADNGDYEVILRDNEVLDTSGNAAPRSSLGFIRVAVAPQWTLTAAADDPARGSIDPSSGSYQDGTTVTLTASPSNYFRFARWQGDLNGTNAVADLLMDTNKTVQGVFAEVVTTNHATPYWWLAQYGFTNDFEQAAVAGGSNGMAYWESYVAGLNPDDPNDIFAVTNFAAGTNATIELFWPSVSGRTYSVHRTTNLSMPFLPVPGATSLSWSVGSFTTHSSNAPAYYRLGVSLE